MILFLFLLGLALGGKYPSKDNDVKQQTDERKVKLLRGSCPPFWFSYGGRCYKYVASRLTWADAELYCLSQKANLVSVYSLEEQNFVKSLISNFDHTLGFTWIGLSDIHKEGRWMWSDGCPTRFFYWSPRQPDNWQGSEHCVEINYGSDKKWNDRPCSATYPSVCATHITCP